MRLHGGDFRFKKKRVCLPVRKIPMKQEVIWSERRDLNSGPPVPQTGALTGLRYAPNIGPHYSQPGSCAATRAGPALPRSPSRPAVMRIFSATKNSLRGIVDGIKTEAAVREEAIAFVLAVPVGIIIAPSLAWYVAMIAALLVVLAVEFLNTAIEKLSDHVTPEQHPTSAESRISAIRRCSARSRLPVWCGSRQSRCAADCSEHLDCGRCAGAPRAAMTFLYI